MSDKEYVKKEISYCLKCKKQTRNKDTHKALMLVNLIPQQSSKCKSCNARNSVFVKEYKPRSKTKIDFTNYKHALLFKV